MSNKVTIRDFGHAMWGDWVARLSGPFSVPSAALSYWVSNDIGKVIFAVTAFACVWVTAYRLWKPLAEKVRPKLKLSYANDKTVLHGNLDGPKQSFLRVTNASTGDVNGAQVIVEELKFRKIITDAWERSQLIATINMSWCSQTDADPEKKFGAIQLPPGGHLVDFIIGPELGTHEATGVKVRGFRLKIDYRHGGVLPFFYRKGMYKFTMQVSAIDAGQSDHLTLLVHWNGTDYSIRTENDTMLEPLRAKKAHAAV